MQPTSNDQPNYTTKPFPGSLTPGWNDPPPLPSNTNVERKRTNLNKRVAFPLQNSATSTPAVLPTSIPGLPPIGAQVQCPSIELPSNALEQIMNQCNQNLLSLPLENQETVKQNLQVMHNLWVSNGLSQEVRLTVYRLSLALRDGNNNLASKELALLQTIHFNECAHWIAALTNLVKTSQVIHHI